ncbi:MMPL family transporter [Ornithinimicrobium sediminis]|uniref:MMPL family transporter n=1 Tax=Ornithinimicrobium sediminis TaxID=2904603 RepID=UPI001E467AB9|nr:MMPL family transporter [Ornithinimicrobium sediminis]
MASLLHRLGRWCADHHWTTIAAWVAVLVLVGGSAAVFSKPLTTEFSIPGSRFEVVLEELRQEIPVAAGATGTVVFTGEDGFDADDRTAVEEVLQGWRELDGVAEVVDPFATQEQLDTGDEELATAEQELADGQAEVDAGRERVAEAEAELDAGQDEVDAGQAELDAAQEELDAGRAQLEAGRDQLPAEQVAAAEQQLEAGQAEIDQAREELDAGQAEVDAGREELEEGRAELEAGQAELDAGREQLAVGERLAGLSEGLRFVSEDGTVALAQVRFVDDVNSLDPALTERVQEIGEQLEGSGVEVDYSQEIVQDLSEVVGPGEILGLVVAAVVLLVVLGSLVAAGLPLLMALVGVAVGVLGALSFSGAVQMNDTTPALALMLGLAVGIDYSLFLINRHRTQLRQGMAQRDSIALATGTSGNAVAFAGMTVIIALAALTVTGVPFLAVMGLVAAATVLVAVLVALTLTPALLSLVGERVLPKRQRAGADGARPGGPRHYDDTERGWAAAVIRRPVLTILGVLALVGVMSFPVADLRLGLPDGSAESADSTAYQTYDAVRSNFGAGVNGPVIAVAELDEPLAEGESALASAQADLGEDLAAIEGVVYVVPFGVSEDRQTLAFQMVPQDGPSEESTVELVGTLEAEGEQIGADNGATLGFTGQTVANIDISNQLSDALPVYLAVVVGLSLLLLLLVFRSVVIPLLATLGFLLSLGAAFGAVVATYQWGVLDVVFGVNEPGPILSFLPILLIGVLFGLAMDYQVFLVSAMRESHVHGEPARQAIVTGFNHSSRVVVAAAVIMVSVFGGFVFAELAMIRPVGLGLAVGVLIDAFVVRMTLTPAVMALLGEKAWYLPRWLDRVLPDVDVEGTALERSVGVGSRPQEVVDSPVRA